MDTLHFEMETVPVRTISLHELFETFEKYQRINSKSDKNNYKKAFDLLQECIPNADTSTFSVLSLMQFQNYLIEKGYARKYCNKLLAFVKNVFKFGHLAGLVSMSLVSSLSYVKPIKIGDARENKKIKGIPKDDFIKILPFVTETVADMLKLQLSTAMRPCEVSRMKFEDIDMEYDGENWLYTPPKHKTAWRGKIRTILLGLEEQEILKKYLNKEADELIFLNTKGNPYTADWFSRLIKKKIDKNNLPKFTAYQLRHTSLTDISLKHGKDAARAVAGHSSEITTGIYDHSDLEKFKMVVNSRNKNIVVSDTPKLRIFTGE
jgi:integrase